MTDASTEIESINAQIADLRTMWNGLAAEGKHAEATSVENEITALERAVARYEIQQKAEQAENARLRAVRAAESTREQIAEHKTARVELEAVVAELEAAAKAVDSAMERLAPAFRKCIGTWPVWTKFKDPAQQEVHDDELGPDKYPSFDALRLRLRLPVVTSILLHRANSGLDEILGAADARF